MIKMTRDAVWELFFLMTNYLNVRIRIQTDPDFSPIRIRTFKTRIRSFLALV